MYLKNYAELRGVFAWNMCEVNGVSGQMDGNRLDKGYFPYLDIIKILSCIGIVAIHTQPFCAYEWLYVRFSYIYPVFVPSFFVVSSLLFWEKIEWSDADWRVLRHFTVRLFVLYLGWNIILSPSWLRVCVLQNPDTWMWMIPLRLFLFGGSLGSWFILSLIYGMWICYLLNRYLNKHVVFVLLFFVWLYYSLVHYNKMDDFLGIFFREGAVDAYFSPIRSVFWIESFYLSSLLRLDRLNKRCFVRCVIALMVAYLGFSFIVNGPCQFVVNALMAFLLPMLCYRQENVIYSDKLVTLRKMSIVVYFSHTEMLSVFNNAYRRGFTSFECGMVVFLSTLVVSGVFAYILVRLSNRYKWLKYFY